MTTVRYRERWKSRVGIVTTRNAIGSHPAVSIPTISDSSFETMLDNVSRPWPPKPKTISRMTRQGLRKTRMSPMYPINYLHYTCRSLRESQGNYKFTDHSNTHNLTWSGNVTQAFKTASGGSFPGSELQLIGTGTNLDLLIELAKSKALSGFDKPTESYGEPSLEAGKTVKLIAKPLVSIRTHVDRYHAELRRIRKGRGYRRRLARHWAEYSLAIMPLWRMVDDSIDLVRDGLLKTVDSQYSTYYGIVERTPNQLQSSTAISLAPISGTLFRTAQFEVRVKAGIVSYIVDINRFATKVGTRARDIPVTLWEATPLSFLVDRVFNVKNVLRSVLALSSSQVRVQGGFVSVRVRALRSWQYRNLTIAAPNKCDSQTNPLYEEFFELTREGWNPTIGDLSPRKLSTGLFSSITSTLDTLALIELKLMGR